jgi:hypothetical protein
VVRLLAEAPVTIHHHATGRWLLGQAAVDTWIRGVRTKRGLYRPIEGRVRKAREVAEVLASPATRKTCL